jgi:CubicO group peptidase (beta-lactamase class C family)
VVLPAAGHLAARQDVARAARRWAAALVLLVGCAAAAAQVFPGAQWSRAADLAAAGWSAQKLDEAADYTRTQLKTTAWMLVHRGVVIREYGDAARVSNVASVRKSIMSILVGMQVDQQRSALDRTLAELGIDDKQGLTAVEKTATVRHLLQGRSGIYHPSAYESAEMKIGRPARGTFKPGENFNYNNWDFNALGTVYTQLAGRTYFDALRDELARPLQMQDFDAARAGHFQKEDMSVHPAYVTRLSARDMARIGLLMARWGGWNGRQLVSRAWVEESTRAWSQIRPGSGYGYLWWVGFSDSYAKRLRFPGLVYMAIGNLGQFIVVDPVRDIVFVHKVDFESSPGADVTSAQFVALLERVLAARIDPP